MDNSFSVGFSGQLNDLKRIISASSNVTSVYTGGVKDLIGGGRPQYVESISDLKNLVKYAKAHNVSFEVALNQATGIKLLSDKPWWNRITGYLKELEQIGVDGIVATHPSVIEAIKKNTSMKVIVSTICEITTPRMASYYQDMEVDVITPSMNINMKLNVLKEIRDTLNKNVSLRIMVNEHCIGDCHLRRFHHDQAFNANGIKEFHLYCYKKFLENSWYLLANNAIRPEDLKYYNNITQDFKILGRITPIDILIKRIKAYSENNFEGNFVELVDSILSKDLYISNKNLNGLIEKKFTCSLNCCKCHFCEEFYKKNT